MYQIRLNIVAVLLLLLQLTIALPHLIGRNIHATSNSVSKRDLATTALATSDITLGATGAYPRLALLSDGSILAVYSQVNTADPTRVLDVLRSTDNGTTFSAYGSIASGNGDIDNGFLLEVPGSSPPVVLAAFRNHDVTDGVDTYYRITVCKSVDGGKTWAYSATPIEGARTDDMTGYWEPFMRIGSDGGVQMTFSYQYSGSQQQTYRSISTDGGVTWSTPVNLLVHAQDVNVHDGMQGIVSITDSGTGEAALVMIFESTPRGQGIYSVMYAVSYDDGATYGDRTLLYEPTNALANAGAPQIASVGTEGLVALFMTDEDQTTINWPNEASEKILVADGLSNGVVSWTTSPVTLQDSPSSWGGLLQVGDDVLAAYGATGGLIGKRLSWPAAGTTSTVSAAVSAAMARN